MLGRLVSPRYFFYLLFFLLPGCSRNLLTVHTEYLSRQDLASYYVGTPDPMRNYPPVGQRLIVSWSLPKDLLSCNDLRIEITIRFGNRQEVVESLSLCKDSGTYVYSLLNEDFFEKEGILTYKVDLFGSGEIIEEWRHQIWADLILFEPPENPPSDNLEETEEAESDESSPHL